MLIWDSPEAVNRFVVENGGGYSAPGSFTALGWTDSSGQLVSGVTFFACNGVSCQMGVATITPFSRGFALAIGHYVVNQLRLRRLTFIIEESNLRSQQLVRHLGATLEATLRDAGKSGNLLIFALFPEDCQLWSKLYGRRRRTGISRSGESNSPSNGG